MKKIIQVFVIFIFFVGCEESDKKILNEFNELKSEVKNNYVNNRATFTNLKSCLELKYLKNIEFKKGNEITIEYQIDDTIRWKKITTNINDDKLKILLKKEGQSPYYLSNLKKELSTINANRLSIIDDYDIEKGRPLKEVEIRYVREVNDLHYYYKIFDRPLDSIETSHYASQTQDGFGGVLDNYVIFYYR